MPITALAMAALEEIAKNPNHGAARGMSKRFKEGRDSIQRAITELREAGLVKTSVQKVGLSFIKSLRPTPEGYYVLETRTSIQLYGLNPNNNLLLDINTDLLSYKPNSSAEEKRMDYEDTPMWLDPEERAEAMRKKREKNHQDKMEFYGKRNAERMVRREHKQASSWTATDSSFEFADQMNLLWHVEPWKVTRSRFRYALSNKRAEYNTDGEIELKMMTIFFDKIKHDTKLSDPEIIWKKFILEFHLLLEQVNRENVTEDDIEQERERSRKSRSKLHVQE